MKTILSILLIIIFNADLLMSQFPVHVKKIESLPNQTVVLKGNLNAGAHMDNLSWAWKNSVACFPATQKQKFTGNHLLYSTLLPERAIMTITVTPDNKNANFSLYAYQIGTTNFSTVPELSSCVACEADYKWDYPKVNKTQDHSRTVELNSTDDQYNIVIGVAGADGLSEGTFALSIKIEGGTKNENLVQDPVKVIPVKSEKNKEISVHGDLKDGVIIHDLSWAWNSSVACFPGTQSKKFTGNHVVYETELPENSEMEIMVVPDDRNADFSLYAYQVGLNNKSIVPDLASCVSCEADYKWDRPKSGKTQDHTRVVSNLTSMENAYRIVIGVVGANGLQTGTYTLKIKVKDRM